MEWITWGDTAAQWLMAVFAVIATIASIIAVVLLRDTLRANMILLRQGRRAATAAIRGAIAAEKTAADAREIGEAQVRAYMSILDVRGTFVRESCSMRFTLKVQNFGQSPLQECTLGIVASFKKFKSIGQQTVNDVPAGAQIELATYPMAKLRMPDDFVLQHESETVAIEPLYIEFTLLGKDVFGKTAGAVMFIEAGLARYFREFSEMPLVIRIGGTRRFRGPTE